jgi:hypothetical protein
MEFPIGRILVPTTVLICLASGLAFLLARYYPSVMLTKITYMDMCRVTATRCDTYDSSINCVVQYTSSYGLGIGDYNVITEAPSVGTNFTCLLNRCSATFSKQSWAWHNCSGWEQSLFPLYLPEDTNGINSLIIGCCFITAAVMITIIAIYHWCCRRRDRDRPTTDEAPPYRDDVELPSYGEHQEDELIVAVQW